MKLSPSQHDVLAQLEAGGRLVKDETGAPWIEDSRGGMRRVRKPTLDSLVRRGYFDSSQLELPRVTLTIEGNIERWYWWLEGIFGSEEYLKATKARRREMIRRAATNITNTFKRAGLYIPEIIG